MPTPAPKHPRPSLKCPACHSLPGVRLTWISLPRWQRGIFPTGYDSDPSPVACMAGAGLRSSIQQTVFMMQQSWSLLLRGAGSWGTSAAPGGATRPVAAGIPLREPCGGHGCPGQGPDRVGNRQVILNHFTGRMPVLAQPAPAAHRGAALVNYFLNGISRHGSFCCHGGCWLSAASVGRNRQRARLDQKTPP